MTFWIWQLFYSKSTEVNRILYCNNMNYPYIDILYALSSVTRNCIFILTYAIYVICLELNIRKIQIYFMHFTEIAKRTFDSLFFFFTFCRNSDSAFVWGLFCSASIALNTQLVWHSLLKYFECCWGERNMSVWQHVCYYT